MSADRTTDSSFIDIPEVSEISSDSLNMTFLHGQTLRIEFFVTRINPSAESNTKAISKTYSCCHIAVTPSAMLEVYKRLSQHVTAMQKSGALKQVQKPPSIIQ